ncbi:MAG: ribosome recycling factor [bacterium]|nr:ribosome recycling factor [bacterium]
MFDSILKKYAPEFEKAIDHFGEELGSLRTGRAKPALVENLIAEVYGSRMQIKELASISAPEPNLLVVKPWDQNIIKDLERALAASPLGLNPSIDGDMIRIKLPDLTEERRTQLVKVLKEKQEQGRISLRHLRDKIREEVQEIEKQGAMSEDDKFRGLEKLDDKTKEYTTRLDLMAEEKEKEIRGV